MLTALIILGIVAGATIGVISNIADQGAALDAIAFQTEQAEAQAALAEETLNTQMTAELGQLHTDFETYDDWYVAQEAEFAAAVGDGFSGSWEEYLLSQQTTELGAAGTAYAELDEQKRYRQAQIDVASDRLEFAYGQGMQKHGAGVTQANRATRHQRAGAASTGFRGGTVEATLTENIRVRNESLQWYLDAVNNQYSTGQAELANAQTGLATGFDIGLAGLNQAVQTAQDQFDLGMAGIELGLTQYTEGLEFQYDQTFSQHNLNMNVLSAGLSGASMVLNPFSAAANNGLINFSPTGGGAITFGGIDLGNLSGDLWAGFDIEWGN